MRRLTICLTLCLTAHAAAAPARTIPLRHGGALSGNEAITLDWTITKGTPKGPISVLAVTADGTKRTLSTIATPPTATNFVPTVVADATNWAVGVRFERGTRRTFFAGERVVTGATHGDAARTLVDCTGAKEIGSSELPIDLAISNADVAWTKSMCSGEATVKLAPAGHDVQTVADTLDDPEYAAYDVRLTPTTIGYAVPRLISEVEGYAYLTLVDRATNTATHVDDERIGDYTLDGDRIAAFATYKHCDEFGGDCVYAFALPTASGLPGPNIGAIDSFVPFVNGGGRVLAERATDDGVAALDTRTGRLSYAGGGNKQYIPVAVDRTTATFITRNCQGAKVLMTVKTSRSAPRPQRCQSASSKSSGT